MKSKTDACGRTGSLTIPNGVERIEKNAYHGNALTSVIIPEGVTEIGWAAFTVSSLSTATIPESITKINDYAFNCRNLTDVYYGGTEEQWNSVVIGSMLRWARGTILMLRTLIGDGFPVNNEIRNDLSGLLPVNES